MPTVHQKHAATARWVALTDAMQQQKLTLLKGPFFGDNHNNGLFFRPSSDISQLRRLAVTSKLSIRNSARTTTEKIGSMATARSRFELRRNKAEKVTHVLRYRDNMMGSQRWFARMPSMIGNTYL